MRAVAMLTAVLVLALPACDRIEDLRPAADLESPPPVTLEIPDGSVELEAHTYCFGSVCADGMPPADPPDVGSPDEVSVSFPLPGWSFTASFQPARNDCGGRAQEVPLEDTGDGTHVLRPAGHPDTYDVTLAGQGDGDLFVTFRWTTPGAGHMPDPQARLAVLADHDGQVDSYGVELELKNLATTPDDATATITVRDAGGDEVAFEAAAAAAGGCRPEGSLYWDGPDERGLEAAALGDGPFTYEVVLELDGSRHVASATWPDDQIPGNEPSVRLSFQPPLPGPA